LPEEDPEILARVLIWLYTRDMYRPHIEKATEETLAKLVPGRPTTERSEFKTCILAYFCADRQGIEGMKLDLADDIGSSISDLEEGDVDGDFTAFVKKVYSDIPAKDDPLRTKVTVETLRQLWRLNLLRARNSDDDSDEDAPKRIQALIRANEPAALEIAIDLISTFRGWA
jgi:hypothetical protein